MSRPGGDDQRVATTPVYSIPYQDLSDPPDGAALGAGIATAVEDEIVRIDATFTAHTAAAPYQARQTLSVTTASITFSSIPSTLRSLTLRWTARGNGATNFHALRMRVNGVSTASYAHESLQGNGAVPTSSGNLADTAATVGQLTAATAFAGVYASGEITFVGWDSPHTAWLGFTCASQAMTSNAVTNHGGGTYGAAGPYTSITLLPTSGSFVAGSDFHLYGLRA